MARRTYMRSLGLFFGELAKAVKQTPESSETPKTVSRTTTETEEREVEGRKVTLRRTVIEEIEMDDDVDPSALNQDPR
ncbi:MAG: hypothetical protein KDA28_02765 [Phycisphaerales bacterium]|nr:hypothetical protein [Phycisphaerales bacterium]